MTGAPVGSAATTPAFRTATTLPSARPIHVTGPEAIAGELSLVGSVTLTVFVVCGPRSAE
jgi:hypothetical protein